jgi:type I restriction enzyme S subunit
VCNFIQSGFAAGGDDQTEDPNIGIPHIRPLNISNTAELHFEGTKMVPRASVDAGDFLQLGEVLFNNTNSTAWVGKSVVFDADRDCACSNHITRLQLADKDDSPYFLAAVFNALRGLGYFGLLATNFNNQAGINVDTLNALRLPWPPHDVQSKIAAEVARRRDSARRLRADADTLWEKARADFECALLGPPR